MDTDNLAGVSPQAASFNGVLKPPPLAGGVNLSFGPGGSATPTATSFVTPAAQNPTWDLGVTAAAPGTVVTVAWPDLTTVPNSLRPVLTDLATGASLYMRTTPAYQFTSGTQPRRFRLSLATGAGVTLTSVTALATAGGGAQITYALAAPAQVSADILNLGGALIRTVSTGTLSPAGISTLVWDGRNAAGSAVPAGMYLVRLTVASDSGERTTALRSLSVSR
jgi:hypothetical protein